MTFWWLLQLYACIVMLIDTYQTRKILLINVKAEANPIIRFIYKYGKMPSVMIFKIAISSLPIITGPLGAFILAIIYSFIVYNNYTGFRDYEIDNSIH